MKVDINYLTSFESRQAVINYYEDGGLIDKDGFFFDRILIEENENLSFIKNGQKIKSIDLKVYHMFNSGDVFKNYFYFSNEENNKVEIYFP